MTRRDIAKELMKALPQEFSPGDKREQLSFDFAPDPKGLQKAEQYVRVIIKLMKEQLQAEQTLEISRFGKFIIRQKNERSGRNPRTKEYAKVTARKVVLFKPSKLLKKIINSDGHAD